jgi:hypothetical protein
VSFLFACVSVGKDLQDELHHVAKGPRTGTKVVGSECAWLFVIAWGCVGIVAYGIAQNYPEWFEKAFSLKLDKNNLLTGLLIGASTVVIIRSNLITVAKMPIGGEFIYSRTRARVVFIMNKRRGLARADFLKVKKTYTDDTQSYPNYFTKMDQHIALIGPPLPTFGSITTEIASIKAGSQTPDQDAAARAALTGVMYDYLGPSEVETWGRRDNWGQ